MLWKKIKADEVDRGQKLITECRGLMKQRRLREVRQRLNEINDIFMNTTY